MQLREYQKQAIAQTWRYLREQQGNPCIVIPTGGGKSPVIAGLIQEAIRKRPNARVLVLAHVKELVKQNHEKLKMVWPQAKAGIYSAGLGRRDIFDQIIFASIQSVHNKAMQLGVFDLVLIDEAHRIPIAGDGMYRNFIGDCMQLNNQLIVIGLTATPYRMASGMVCGEDAILRAISYEVGVKDLIDGGYLCRLISKAGLTKANLTGVHMRGGEYVQGELETAMSAEGLVQSAVKEMVSLCADRQSWIIFCSGIAHAAAVSAELAKYGINAPAVDSASNKGDRDKYVKMLHQKKIRALCNVNIFSEGFDVPHIDAVVLMRPTKSPGLYYQQVGRGLRMHPDKTNCLVLDFAGNILTHGPIDCIQVRRARLGGGASNGAETPQPPPCKECPKCQSIVHAAALRCQDCDHEFQAKAEANHYATASYAPIISDEIFEDIKVFRVDNVYYAKHDKQFKTPSLRVTYQCGRKAFREWVCIEHTSGVRKKAESWWRKRSDAECPSTVDDALRLADGLKPAKFITVSMSGKYPEILNHELD